MREPSPMDMLVFGPLRSGTTLLADLLTVKGRSLVVSEPDLHVQWHQRTVDRLDRLYRDVGLAVGPVPPQRQGRKTYAEWFSDEILPQLERLDLWGMKMVDFHEWEKLIARHPPRRMVLMTRDLRDAAISALDLIGRSQIAFPGGKRLRDEAWVMARLAHDVHELTRVANLPHLHLRYEDFTADPELQDRLRRYAGLAAFGADRFNLEGENERRVGWEKARHRGAISAASVGRFAREPEGPARAMAERIWRMLPVFARRFGHEAPEAPLSDHPYARAGQAEVNPIGREIDVEGWDASGPTHLEPVFARRAARIRISETLARPCRVLDLFCGAPTMRFLLKKGSAYRGADVAPRFEGCETIDLARLGLPPRRDSEVVTIAGALEYLGDPYGFLTALAAQGATVLASYHASDDTRGTERTALGWKNHLTRHDLVGAFHAAGFRTEVQWAFDGRQSLVKASPTA